MTRALSSADLTPAALKAFQANAERLQAQYALKRKEWRERYGLPSGKMERGSKA